MIYLSVSKLMEIKIERPRMFVANFNYNKRNLSDFSLVIVSKLFKFEANSFSSAWTEI